jgi:hypothetical protein
MDRDLRDSIKRIYHLPQCTADGLIYCGKRDGGLGIPKLESTVVSSSLGAGIQFLNNTDPVLKALSIEAGLEKRMRRLAESARLPWPINMSEIRRYKTREKRAELTVGLTHHTG